MSSNETLANETIICPACGQSIPSQAILCPYCGYSLQATDSILISIKKLLGLTGDYLEFDQDLIIHINTILSNLHQIGVGPANGFIITGASEKWSDFIGTSLLYQQVKSYIYIKVRLLFDPPTNPSLLEATIKFADELEWRLCNTEEGED